MKYTEIMAQAQVQLIELYASKPGMGYWEISTIVKRAVKGIPDMGAFLRENLSEVDVDESVGFEVDADDEAQEIEVSVADVLRRLVNGWLTVALQVEWDRLMKLAKGG